MALVTLAALLTAALYLFFKAFDRRGIPLLPAIVVNYVVACCFGILFSQPWEAGDLSLLWGPSLGQGLLFIGLFYLSGHAAQRIGVAPTTVAVKMGLVLTVLVAVIVFHERPGVLGWTGIALALVGVALSSWTKGGVRGRGWWMLVVLFFGSALSDILLNTVQRTRLTPLTEAVFPTLVFGCAACLGAAALIARREARQLWSPRVLIGGTLLGCANYGSLYFTVHALAASGFPASTVFPMMNIGVILAGSAASVGLFHERIGRVHLAGIAICIIALACLLAD